MQILIWIYFRPVLIKFINIICYTILFMFGVIGCIVRYYDEGVELRLPLSCLTRMYPHLKTL